MLAVGKSLGDFEIIRLLGKGGMGEVYEARQSSPSRLVALKVLAPWLSQNEEALERFWREAAVPAQLDHPGIVRVFTTGKTSDGQAYYTMQLVRGISLAALIRKSCETLPSTAAILTTPPNHGANGRGPRSPAVGQEYPVGEPPPRVLEAYRADRWRFVAKIGVQVARALADAHEKGFLHRDIKPSNLMLDHHEHLYVLDFGLTRALDPGASRTQAGVIRGTPWYMSPEQARGEEVTPQSDIYSLGVTLYELATEGKGPFTANRENSEAVLTQVRAGQLTPVRSLAPDMPHRLGEIITRALHFKGKRRYRSASDMASALEAFLAPQARTGSSLHRPSLSRWWPIGVSAVGAIALFAVMLGRSEWLRTDREGGPSNQTPLAAVPNQNEANASPREKQKSERLLNVRRNLLTTENQPIMKSPLIPGRGRFSPQADHLSVVSLPGSDRTLVPLEQEQEGNDFEFAVEVKQLAITQLHPNRVGLYIGHRPSPAAGVASPLFLCVEIAERPLLNDPASPLPHGVLRIQACRDHLGVKFLGGFGMQTDLDPHAKSIIALGKSGCWHSLRLRKSGDVLSINVDDRPTHEIDVGKLRRQKQGFESLYLHGALGLFAEGGQGGFRNASLTALPSAGAAY